MSFSADTTKALDDSLSVGLRYISLRHAVGRFCPLGFNRTWEYLAARFTLIAPSGTAASNLTNAAHFLRDWHRIMVEQRSASITAKRRLLHLGIPKQLQAKLRSLK